LIGFLGGLFNLVPYIGPIVASGLGVLLTISSNLDLEFYTQMKPLIIKVLLTFWSVQFLDNFILHPYIFSNSVKAHPLEIFMIVLVGAHLGGAAGMILATPLYTTGKIILKAFFREYKFVQFLTGNMDEPPAPVLEINDEDDTISQSEIG
jgi:predicted PurR-regulated permease PerM